MLRKGQKSRAVLQTHCAIACGEVFPDRSGVMAPQISDHLTHPMDLRSPQRRFAQSKRDTLRPLPEAQKEIKMAPGLGS